MCEQIFSHLRSDRCRHLIKRKFLAIAKYAPSDTDNHDAGQELCQKFKLPSYNDVIYNFLCDLRINHIQHDRNDHGAYGEQIALPVPQQIAV